MKVANRMLPPEVIPDDHSRQVTTVHCVRALVERGISPVRVLDVGCGEGDSIDVFKQLSESTQWEGVDIEDSNEVSKRTRTDGRFHSFDGVSLPFADGSFDLLYCRQVFEHVRFPEALLCQMHRVLKPGGFLVLSASYLEPYHSRSLWCYTPFGFHELLTTARFDLSEMRPGIDGLTLLIRRLAGRPRFFDRWLTIESPLNKVIGLFGRLTGKSHRWINERKLLYCGHFCVVARRAEQ